MAMLPEEFYCGSSYSYSEEVLQVLTCAVLGFALMRVLLLLRNGRKIVPKVTVGQTNAATSISLTIHQHESSPITKWTRSRRCGEASALSSKVGKPSPTVCESLAQLPIDINSSLAAFVDLADLASLAVTSRSTRDSFWQPQQVWAEVSAARGICSQPVLADGNSAEDFRRMFFHISADQASELLSQAREMSRPTAEILEEVAQMVRGLMPHDDASVLSCALQSATDAIWAHTVSNYGAAREMESFMQLARRRNDLLSPWQLESLEDAYSASLDLDSSLKLTLQQDSDALPAFQADAADCWLGTPFGGD